MSCLCCPALFLKERPSTLSEIVEGGGGTAGFPPEGAGKVIGEA
ncbi:MAG: hypothetical protein OXF02_01135 [Simkaniaceae bacterium]|nr:hypothetical protein [Simkaniaceae bacterium]